MVLVNDQFLKARLDLTLHIIIGASLSEPQINGNEISMYGTAVLH